MHIFLGIDVLSMAQATEHRQLDVLAIAEEVGGAEQSLQPCGWTADRDRGCTQSTDKDLASLWGFLLTALDI